jgi:hypothetical protein
MNENEQTWSIEDLEEHIKVNVKDHGAMVVVGALFKNIYGVYPKIGLSGFQASCIDQLSESIANIKELRGKQ